MLTTRWPRDPEFEARMRPSDASNGARRERVETRPLAAAAVAAVVA